MLWQVFLEGILGLYPDRMEHINNILKLAWRTLRACKASFPLAAKLLGLLVGLAPCTSVAKDLEHGHGATNMTTLEEELDRRLYCLKQFAKTATSLIQVRLEVWRCTNSMLTKCLRAWTSKKLPRMLRAPRASRAPGTIPKLPRAEAEVNVVVNE